MPPAYRFVDRWVVPAPIERVYDAIGDVLGYERWWTDFVIRATGDGAPPEPGKKNELLVKAYLPYKVDFGLEVLESRAAAADPLPSLEGLRRERRVGAGGDGRNHRGHVGLAPGREPAAHPVSDARPTPALPLEPQLGDASRRAPDPRIPRHGRVERQPRGFRTVQAATAGRVWHPGGRPSPNGQPGEARRCPVAASGRGTSPSLQVVCRCQVFRVCARGRYTLMAGPKGLDAELADLEAEEERVSEERRRLHQQIDNGFATETTRARERDVSSRRRESVVGAAGIEPATPRV